MILAAEKAGGFTKARCKKKRGTQQEKGGERERERVRRAGSTTVGEHIARRVHRGIDRGRLLQRRKRVENKIKKERKHGERKRKTKEKNKSIRVLRRAYTWYIQYISIYFLPDSGDVTMAYQLSISTHPR